MTAVSSAPTRIPNKGLENFVKIPVNSGTFARGFTAALMASIPNISTANPNKIVPISFFFSPFLLIKKIIPISASTGEKEVGFSSFKKKLSPSRPDKLKIQDVMVVPMLAPIIMPMAWESFIIPEFTNPTSITVVAEEDCIRAVTPAPSSTAFKGFDVSFSKICSSRPPDMRSSPLPSTFIPYRNKESPPINDRNPKKSICFLLLSFSVY